MAKIQIKRGLEASRLAITPAIGELIWTTDGQKLYVGDGITAGGIDITTSTLGDYILASEKGVANGVATLDAGGKVPVTQLPALAITTVQVAADETAQLSLTTEEGDVVVRTDESATYIRNAGVSGTMLDYTLLATPTDAVASVNGKTGVVTLDSDEIAEGSVNLYYTDLRVDARIAAASVGDLADVDVTTTAPVAGDFLEFDGASWVPTSTIDAGTF